MEKGAGPDGQRRDEKAKEPDSSSGFWFQY